jgi:hypothetical protein
MRSFHALAIPYLTLILLLAQPPDALGEPVHLAQRIAADPSTQVVAAFTGGRITLDDMQAVLDHRPRSLQVAAASANGRQHLLSELVDYDLLVLEAERRGYRARPITRQAAQRAAVDALLADTQQAAAPAPEAAEIAAYFAEHASDFQRPALRRASHIQLASEAEARALVASLVAAGASREQFAALARERSEDKRTRRQGGELGYCDEHGQAWERTAADNCPTAIAQAIFALGNQTGLVPEPVAHDALFSVVMMTGQMPAKMPTLKKVRPAIVEQLTQRARAQRLAALLARLRAERPVAMHLELLQSLALPVARPSDSPAGFPAAPADPRVPPASLEPDGI